LSFDSTSIGVLEQELTRRLAAFEPNAGGPNRSDRQRLARRLWQEMGAVDENRIRIEFIRVARAIGLEAQTAPKVFRHQFATALQEGRVDPLVRNLLMGHAAAGLRSPGHGLGMTAVYTHTRPETVREQLFVALLDRPVIAIAQRWVDRWTTTIT
jgi:AcrR family transcriptional regulator